MPQPLRPAMMPLADLRFDEWIEHAFGHDVRIGRPQWFWDSDAQWWTPQPAVAVDYLTRLFRQADILLDGFADRQIAQGLTYLVDTSVRGETDWLCARSVPVARRRACIEATATLFGNLFARRCAAALGHLGESAVPSINGVCYMWWDSFPAIAQADDPHRDALHDAALQTMSRILSLPAAACQESALHGLGHWHWQRAEQVERIIDRYVATGAMADPRLLDYAAAARCGCVQ